LQGHGLRGPQQVVVRLLVSSPGTLPAGGFIAPASSRDGTILAWAELGARSWSLPHTPLLFVELGLPFGAGLAERRLKEAIRAAH
jgi:hypothetical protein